MAGSPSPPSPPLPPLLQAAMAEGRKDAGKVGGADRDAAGKEGGGQTGAAGAGQILLTG